MKRLRDQGYTVADVEYRLPFTQGRTFGFRKDLFGFGDLLAIMSGPRVEHQVLIKHGENMIVQVCRKADMKNRIKKIRETPEHKVWLSIPSNRIVVHGWYQQKERGLWLCKIEEVTL